MHHAATSANWASTELPSSFWLQTVGFLYPHLGDFGIDAERFV